MDNLAKALHELKQLQYFAENCYTQKSDEDFVEIAGMAGCVAYELTKHMSDEEKEDLHDFMEDFKGAFG